LEKKSSKDLSKKFRKFGSWFILLVSAHITGVSVIIETFRKICEY